MSTLPLLAIWEIHSLIHLAVCLTTGPKPLPKPPLHIVWSRASSFRCEYPLLPLRSSSSFLHLLACLPVTSILPFISPSITCCRRQFLHKMWPIQVVFCLLISCRMIMWEMKKYYSGSYKRYFMKFTVFWDVVQCSVISRYQCFIRVCCLFLHGSSGGRWVQ
jgi:hypothetical protein